jgi:cell filamentation protein
VTDDPYVYPGTTVLRNALGIRDREQLRALEGDLTRSRAARLASNPLPGRYHLEHLQRFHRELFDGLYDWAGKLRTVPIAKRDLFCLPQHIQSSAHDIFDALARERHLSGMSYEDFIDRLAHYLSNVNALHPFRDGNGRTQRAFFSQLAHDAGYRLQWQHVDYEQNNDASIAAMRGNEQPLRDMLTEVVCITAPPGERRPLDTA